MILTRRKYLLSSSEWQASVRSVKLRSTTLCTGVFLFHIKRHLMSGNEFACSLGSSSAKIAWVWTQQTRWKTLANNVRRYSSRCVRAFRLLQSCIDRIMDVSTWISNRIIVCSLIDQTASSLSSLTEEEQTKQVLELSKELKRRVACVDALTLPAG